MKEKKKRKEMRRKRMMRERMKKEKRNNMKEMENPIDTIKLLIRQIQYILTSF